MVKRDTLATYCLTVIIVIGIGEGERKQIGMSFGKAGFLKRYPIQIILVDAIGGCMLRSVRTIHRIVLSQS